MKDLKFSPKSDNCPAFGAHVSARGVEYVTWSPEHDKISIVVETLQGTRRSLEMESIEDGFFRCLDPDGRAGDRYGYSIDGREPVACPASRFQPDGVFGLAEVVDASNFIWKATNWKRPTWNGHVVYELHIGTFTLEGTWLAAIEKLDHLVNLGITAVEIMPVGQWAGDRNWGYDGVYLYAPACSYGSPDDMRTFVDACHLRGLAVILDVVFNHLGPVGDFSERFTKYFWLGAQSSDWGCNFNVDGKQRGPVRAFLLQNLRYWLEDFRVDGFRFDASSSIKDKSPKHILAEMAELVHAQGGFTIAEDHENNAEIFKPAKQGGWDTDASWSNEFHHSARVSQTGEREAFYMSYVGTAGELADVLEHGWVYRGQVNPRDGKPRGSECIHLPPERFVHYLSTHDMVGNRTRGDRLHEAISGEAYCAIPPDLPDSLHPHDLHGPGVGLQHALPVLQQRAEDCGYDVLETRVKQFTEEGLNSDDLSLKRMLHPRDPAAFAASKLNWAELANPKHSPTLDLYRDALHLRRRLFGAQNPPRDRWAVAATGNAVEIRYQLDSIETVVRYNSPPRSSICQPTPFISCAPTTKNTVISPSNPGRKQLSINCRGRNVVSNVS